MNGNSVRGPQWQRLVGEFFAPILGGSRAAWATANRAVITTILEPSSWATRVQEARDYATFERTYRLDWLGFMCTMVGVTMPAEGEALALATRAERWIRPQVGAALPGAVDSIRMLHSTGYRLFTASGESSDDLDDYLRGMEVRACFERLYGPDLIETFKQGPEFYARVFADANVAPQHALVVDDSPAAIGWALDAGAGAVLVGNGMNAPGGAHRIQSLCELPHLLSALEGYP